MWFKASRQPKIIHENASPSIKPKGKRANAFIYSQNPVSLTFACPMT